MIFHIFCNKNSMFLKCHNILIKYTYGNNWRAASACMFSRLYGVFASFFFF